jgi:hypothetical protein
MQWEELVIFPSIPPGVRAELEADHRMMRHMLAKGEQVPDTFMRQHAKIENMYFPDNPFHDKR